MNLEMWGKKDVGGDEKQLIKFAWPNVLIVSHSFLYQCIHGSYTGEIITYRLCVPMYYVVCFYYYR